MEKPNVVSERAAGILRYSARLGGGLKDSCGALVRKTPQTKELTTTFNDPPQSPRPGPLILYHGDAISLGRRLLITEAAAQTDALPSTRLAPAPQILERSDDQLGVCDSNDDNARQPHGLATLAAYP